MVVVVGIAVKQTKNIKRMGLRHVLEHYLRGLRVGPATLRGLPDLDGDLRDMQFESAWRMCEWDPALAVSDCSEERGEAYGVGVMYIG